MKLAKVEKLYVSLFSIILLTVFIFSCDVKKEESVTVSKRGFISDSCMVVSAHPLASKIGVEVMRKGGNAIDAAIAVQFALSVVHPSAGNIGGGGFMVIRLEDGICNTLDFRETAPQQAHRDLYLDNKGEVIDRLSLDGHLAAGVPGTVDGMWKAHQQYGSLSWKDLVQPSIDLAKNGFELTQKEADGLNSYVKNKSVFNTIIPDYITSKTWQKGDLLILNDLSVTLELIRDLQREGFYAGVTAELIAEEMKRGGGIITLEDLRDYKSVWRDPIIGTYKDCKLISMPPPSSGGICLLQMLKMVESYPLEDWGFHSEKSIHLMVESERRAFADRAEYLGDPDFVKIPNGLLDSIYLLERMRSFDPEIAGNSEKVYPGDPFAYESEETTHFSIVDPFGNAVSVTTTLNASYGSGVMVHKAGFLLNNEMDDFSAKPGVPNLFGLVGGEANSIHPKKRMLSSMTPTIVEKNDQLFMVVGTPGGSTIITAVFQTILNVIEFGLTMQQSVYEGRFHHQWFPDEIRIEKDRFDKEDINTLINMGHKVNDVNTMNRVDAILVLPDGKYEGGADPRGDDQAIGF